MKEILDRLREARKLSVYESIEKDRSPEFVKLSALFNSNPMSAQRIESLVLKYQPDANNFFEITDDIAARILGQIIGEYQREIDTYGDDAEIPYEAYDILGLHQSTSPLSEMSIPTDNLASYAVRWVIYELYRRGLKFKVFDRDNIEIDNTNTLGNNVVVQLSKSSNTKVCVRVPAHNTKVVDDVDTVVKTILSL